MAAIIPEAIYLFKFSTERPGTSSGPATFTRTWPLDLVSLGCFQMADHPQWNVEFPPVRQILVILGSAIFLILAPGIVAGYVPWLICRWQVEAPLLGTPILRFAGVLLIAAGLPVLLDSFARFALQGRGTPAPVFPTRHLVASGLFRYVRNPMYAAVVSLIFGQGLFFASVRVLEYGIAVWAGFHLFVLVYEEPTLRKAYGPEYEQFCAHVPRWIPRLRPWSQGKKHE
jgi:protein-S-isoprenylcysteine O-methyltransferase Ste14